MASANSESPRSVRTLNSVAGGVGKLDLPQYRLRAAEDMANRAVQMSFPDFMKNLLPLPNGEQPAPFIPKPRNPFWALKKANEMSEAQIVDIFTDAVNSENLSPGLVLSRSEYRPESLAVDEKQMKIDAALLHARDVPIGPDAGKPRWADQIVSVEFKSHPTGGDPFDDTEKDGSLDASAEDRTKVRGQIISYAELVFAVQQRVALFMLLVMGRNFRLLRWDRAGAIVTEAIDYHQYPEPLCEFLQRVSDLRNDDEALGFDTSATRLHLHDHRYRMMDAAAKEQATDVSDAERPLEDGELEGEFTFAYVRKMFRDSLVPEWPRFELKVPDGDKKTRSFLVCKPRFCASGMAGRGTRGYVALEVETKRFFWLKDAWRASYLSVEKEGDVLKKLNDAKVTNVPTLVCHGDILEQRTKTAEWWEKKHPRPPRPQSRPLCVPFGNASLSSSRTIAVPETPKDRKRKHREEDTDVTLSHSKGLNDPNAPFRTDCPLRSHTHYRLVVQEVAKPLKDFKNGKQLIELLVDCLVAHRQAMTRPGVKILHRDISGGNILIYPKVVNFRNKGTTALKRKLAWVGILADWELSKPVPNDGKLIPARQPERTGTWQYTSVNLLANEDAPVKLPDELESIIHVLIYYSVRYLKSNCTDSDVALFIDDFFDCYTLNKGKVVCGEKKTSTITERAKLKLTFNDDLLFGSPLDKLIPKLLQWFRSYYLVNNILPKAIIPPTQRQSGPSFIPDGDFRYDIDDYSDEDDDNDSGEEDDDEVDDDDDDDNDNEGADTIKGPTPLDKKRAKKLKKHAAMFKELVKASRKTTWSLDDKAPRDRVPSDWKSPRKVMPMSVGSAIPNKRARTDGPRRGTIISRMMPNLRKAGSDRV